jgi:hypothetical protein
MSLQRGMKISGILAIFALAATLAAQRSAPTPDPATPAGKLLQQIISESDLANKRALLEQFVSTFPDHDAAAWVDEQLMDSYRSANEPDQMLAVGERLLTIDPMDFTTAQTCLNTALQMKKDPDLVLKWAEIISDIADRLAHSPKPTDANEISEWEIRLSNARMVEIYTESVLYEAAQQTKDPYKVIELGEALALHNADSEYASPMAELLFKAYLETGDNEKAFALAKTMLARSPNDVQMLLNLASMYKSRKQPEKALSLAKQAVDLTNTEMTPEGMSDAQWEPRKIALRSFGEYLEGVIYATAEKWSDADVELRASLPGIQRPQSKAEALYYLGLANYRLAEKGDAQRASDALLFSKQSADIPSSFQQQARQNAEAIRAKFQLQ